MLKPLLLAGVMLAAAPALAQSKVETPDAQPQNQTAPQSAPQPPAPASAAPDPAADMVEVKTDTSVPASSMATPTPSATPTPPAAAEPKASLEDKAQPTAPDSVAAAVDSEFSSNDKDADGKLNRAEFATWMVRLKARSDPALQVEAPATKAWLAGAWRLADRDRNAGVTPAELTGFLSQGRS